MMKLHLYKDDFTILIRKAEEYSGISADIIESGITLTGGSAMLRGLAQLIEQETNMPVTVAANPIDCVVAGTAKRLEPGHRFDNYVFRRGKKYR